MQKPNDDRCRRSVLSESPSRKQAIGLDIVLHIGLSKCASSTLQSRVFARLPGYLGTRSDLPLARNFGKQFQHLCPVGGRTTFDLSAAHRWRDKVEASLGAEAGLTTCMVSSENLSSLDRFHRMP